MMIETPRTEKCPPAGRITGRLPALAFAMSIVLASMLAPLQSVYAQCAMGNENSWVVATTPASAFEARADGTLLHRPTRRVWQRCALGQSWDGTSCSGAPDLLTWSDALAAADGHQQAGFDDWRLPNRNELASIVEARCFAPALNGVVFPAAPAGTYWTGSPVIEAVDQAWFVDFVDGRVEPSATTIQHAVRLVRGGPW